MKSKKGDVKRESTRDKGSTWDYTAQQGIETKKRGGKIVQMWRGDCCGARKSCMAMLVWVLFWVWQSRRGLWVVIGWACSLEKRSSGSSWVRGLSGCCAGLERGCCVGSSLPRSFDFFVSKSHRQICSASRSISSRHLNFDDSSSREDEERRKKSTRYYGSAVCYKAGDTVQSGAAERDGWLVNVGSGLELGLWTINDEESHVWIGAPMNSWLVNECEVWSFFCCCFWVFMQSFTFSSFGVFALLLITSFLMV